MLAYIRNFIFIPILLCSLCALHTGYANDSTYQELSQNPYISKEIRKTIEPYLLPSTHPIKPILDQIFKTQRATLNEETLANAGFITKFIQPRSFIRVVSHPLMPGYLFKLHLDSELRQKRGKPGWHWFTLRCIGVEKVRHIIKKENLKYFIAPHKWIYPLPADPSPPNSPTYTRHLTLLVVEDMELATKSENLNAWKTKITPKQLKELYTIIAYAKGSSYRAQNIPYTIHGKYAFIDTEYPDQKAHFSGIRTYLSPTMQAYWDDLVKRKKKKR